MRRPLRPNEVQKVIEHLGFKFCVSSASHWHFKKDGVGKVTIPQYGEIGEDLFMWICRQAKITKKQFWKIFDELKL